MSPEVDSSISRLHPLTKRKLRAAADDLARDRAAGKALRDELRGYFSLRIGSYRLVYRRLPSGGLELVAFGPRRLIYQDAARLIRRTKGGD